MPCTSCQTSAASAGSDGRVEFVLISDSTRRVDCSDIFTRGSFPHLSSFEKSALIQFKDIKV